MQLLSSLQNASCWKQAVAWLSLIDGVDFIRLLQWLEASKRKT